ncbi:MAG: hypothetical protein AB1451_14735 [Nitrospirota bacterium]
MIRSRLATMGALFMLIYTGTESAAETPSAEPKRSWYSVSGLLAGRYEAVWNINPALDQSLDHNESRLLGYVTATLSVRPLDALEGVLTLASREISRETLDDGSVEDRWGTTRFIDEAWLKASRGSSWIKAGKQRLVIGRGLVLDSYQPAVAGNLAVGTTSPRVDVKAFSAGLDEDGVLREDQSLYAGGRVDLSFPFAGRVSVSVSRLWDRNATIPTLLPTNIRLALDNAPFRPDDGSLMYWIVDGAARSGDWTFDALAVLQTGTLSGVVNPSIPQLAREETITLLGKAAEASATYRVNHRLTLGATGLYTGGDSRGPIAVLRDRRYEAFVGIYPLIDATNLFFNGGIDSAFTSGTPTASGVLGRGVLAGVLTANMAIERATLRVVAADLWSEFPATDGSGRHYGVEIDTEWAYALTDWLTARLEADVLVPGSFYRTDLDPEPVYKLAIGTDVAW